MYDILQIIGGVIAIASMIFIDILAIKKYKSNYGSEEARLMFYCGILFGSIFGILLFAVFDAISTLF